MATEDEEVRVKVKRAEYQAGAERQRPRQIPFSDAEVRRRKMLPEGLGSMCFGDPLGRSPRFTFADALIFTPEVKASVALERYYVLPCCLLLLNLCNEIVAYKARLIADGALRTLFIMGMVLFGASLVAFAVAPGIIWTVQSLRRTSRSTAGRLGELGFLLVLGGLIFWLYHRNYILGTEAILPATWRNE